MVISQPTCGSIAGTKWNDLNGDGNRDPGEPGLAGWRINVRWQSNNTIAGSAITNANGDYIVTGLLYIGPDVDTKYVVEEVLQSGWTQTYPSSGVWNVHLKEKSDSCYATGNDFGNHLIKSLSGFTAEVWVKWNIPPNAGGNSSRTWATIVVDGDSDSNSRYHLQHNSDNTLFEFAAATNLSRQYAQSTTSPTINTWYYVVGVYNQTDPTNNRIKIYVNGTLEKSVVIDNGGLKASPNRYQVGGPAGIQWPGPTSMLRKFDGDIRGLYTYERAMDPSEVASRFAAGLPAF